MTTPDTTPDTTPRTTASLGKAVHAEMDATYTLVYLEQGMTLPDDVVAALVRGDNPWETKGGDALGEWEGDVSARAAHEKVDELARDIVRRWEREDQADYDDLLESQWPGCDERYEAIDSVRDRDVTTWFRELVSRHGKVLLRVGIDAMDEDAGLSFTPMTEQEFLDLLGFEHTEANLAQAADVVANASPEFSVVMGYALLGVELTDVVDLPEEGRVELRNPHVWLGNPVAGSGWCSEEPFTGTLTVDRDRLRTDADAFGYPWATVVGGTSPGYFGGTVAAVPDQAAEQADSPA